jgi:hypothetical protein
MNNDKFFTTAFIITCFFMVVMFSYDLGRRNPSSGGTAPRSFKSSQAAASPSAQKMRDLVASGKFSDKEALFWRNERTDTE